MQTNYGFVARWGWIPGRKAAGDLRRLRPARQTGLRVEVILRLPEATLQGYRGKSGGRLDAFILRSPRPPCMRHSGRPLESGLRKSRITNNPAEVCPSGRSRRRSPAAFLAVPDGTMALARGGTPIVSGGRFRYLIKKYWRQSAAISQQLLSETILMTLSENLGEEF